MKHLISALFIAVFVLSAIPARAQDGANLNWFGDAWTLFRTVSYDNPVWGSEDSDTTFLFRFRLGAFGEQGSTSIYEGIDIFWPGWAHGDPTATTRSGTADCGDPNCQRCIHQTEVGPVDEDYECCKPCDPGPCEGRQGTITSLGICATDYANFLCAVACEGYYGIPRGEGGTTQCNTVLRTITDCENCRPRVCAGEGFTIKDETIGYASCNRCSQSDYVCCRPPECE